MHLLRHASIRVRGKVVAGFAAFHFTIDEPLPDDLVRSLVPAKLATLRT